MNLFYALLILIAPDGTSGLMYNQVPFSTLQQCMEAAVKDIPDMPGVKITPICIEVKESRGA